LSVSDCALALASRSGRHHEDLAQPVERVGQRADARRVDAVVVRDQDERLAHGSFDKKAPGHQAPGLDDR
jgi:hypothetical protein